MVGGWRSLSARSGCSSGSSAPQRSMMPPRLSTQEIEANAGASKLAFEWAAQAETMARQALANGYRLCAACSVRLVGMELCAHHTAREHVDSWAAGNRIWCVFKLLLNGTRVEVASGSNEGTSKSVLSGDPGRAVPASALIEMDAATGMQR